MTTVEPFTIRLARPDDEPVIAGLVVEGFLDKFRPVFGGRMDQSIRIMEQWISLEHASGGVTSLIVEGGAAMEIVGSVGVRAAESREDVLARGLWATLRRNLGFPRASWAAVLLSHPRYLATSSEAYVERLVVVPEYRNHGLGRSLLHAAESLAHDAGRDTVGLHVSSVNIPALKLYEDEGYEEVSRQRSWLTGRFLNIRDWIYLRKAL